MNHAVSSPILPDSLTQYFGYSSIQYDIIIKYNMSDISRLLSPVRMSLMDHNTLVTTLVANYGQINTVHEFPFVNVELEVKVKQNKNCSYNCSFAFLFFVLHCHFHLVLFVLNFLYYVVIFYFSYVFCNCDCVCFFFFFVGN